ncbi:hypothetical protein GGP66_002694 [Salinibacter ruber]|nr:hypothetical protein [Salinibacter ruber]
MHFLGRACATCLPETRLRRDYALPSWMMFFFFLRTAMSLSGEYEMSRSELSICLCPKLPLAVEFSLLSA